jgi:hypothetical protein
VKTPLLLLGLLLVIKSTAAEQAPLAELHDQTVFHLGADDPVVRHPITNLLDRKLQRHPTEDRYRFDGSRYRVSQRINTAIR